MGGDDIRPAEPTVMQSNLQLARHDNVDKRKEKRKFRIRIRYQVRDFRFRLNTGE